VLKVQVERENQLITLPLRLRFAAPSTVNQARALLVTVVRHVVIVERDGKDRRRYGCHPHGRFNFCNLPTSHYVFTILNGGGSSIETDITEVKVRMAASFGWHNRRTLSILSEA